jgi:hypothetical protein
MSHHTPTTHNYGTTARQPNRDHACACAWECECVCRGGGHHKQTRGKTRGKGWWGAEEHLGTHMTAFNRRRNSSFASGSGYAPTLMRRSNKSPPVTYSCTGRTGEAPTRIRAHKQRALEMGTACPQPPPKHTTAPPL